jgi:DNA polymerase IV (DinB-like DNA polymerase)
LNRVIGHIDLDYFYAQVEEVLDPSIKGRPVIVCVFSGRTEDSGVVSTANYRARDLSVHSGMPIALAKKKLRDVNPVIIKMEHEKYELVSERVMRLVKEKVDAFEQTGIDEAFFDLSISSGGDYQTARKIAEGIKETILREEGLTCSIGLGRSKVVAKLGSDMAKPAGLIVIEQRVTEAFLRPLPVSRLYGVGPKTTSALEELGVKTIGELASTSALKLEEKLGKKFSTYLLAASTGSDDDPVREGLEPTQFSRIVTLKRDSRDPNEVVSQLKEGIQYVHDKLTTTNKSFKTVSAIGILTDLSIHTKSKTLDTPVTDASTIEEDARELFAELGKSVSKDFRRAGIRVSGLLDNADQSSLSEFLQQR